ncbi:MAG: hypothetical protein WDW36_008628 [Sanguina aurantia]
MASAATVNYGLTTEKNVQLLPPIPTTFEPLPELTLPVFTRVVLPNGMRVLLLQDREVPLVRGELLMRGGQYASPADKIGIATLSASVQRAGGSIAHPAPAVNERLEQLAASIEAGAGPQAVSVGFQCLVPDFPEVLGLFSEIVRTPQLDNKELQFFKAQVKNSISHQYDSSGAVSRRQLQQLVYGKDSLYARQPTEAQVEALRLSDVADFISEWERPDTAVLGMVGDFELQPMLEQLTAAFGDWAPAEGQPATARIIVPPFDLPPQSGAGRVYLVDRPGSTQASVAMAEPGVSLTDPAMFPLEVLGSVFNSFGGQLFDQIRSRQGLAYSVSGGWDSPIDHQGLFVAGGETSSPAQFLTALKSVLTQATLQPPAQEELDTAKAETLNSFVFNFSSLPAQMQRILSYELLDLPQDYLFRYIDGIKDVSTAGVLEAATQHLHPELQTTVITADAKAVRESLVAAGFDPIDLELPNIRTGGMRMTISG